MENMHLVIQGIVSDKSRKIILDKLKYVWEEGSSFTEFPILSNLFRSLGSNFFLPKYRQRSLADLGYITKEEFPHSEFLFFQYSDFDIAKGTIFSHFFEADNAASKIPIYCKIGMVTQQFALPYSAIPLGHKTLCQVIFDRRSYDLIHSKIPKVDNWTRFGKSFMIAT